MTTRKSSSPEQSTEVDPSATHPERGGPKAQSENEKVSDDLNRIADYLTEKRATQSTRDHDLAEEITTRRTELPGHTGTNAHPDHLRDDLSDDEAPIPAIGRSGLTPYGAVQPLTPNPVLAERLHNFCCELDDMLENFRARVEYRNSVKH